MAQLNVRLDDETRESFDALARARGLTTSDLIRALIDDALGVGDKSRSAGSPVPASLSAVERRSFMLQHEILSRLTAGSGDPEVDSQLDYHLRMVEVLKSGFATEYDRVFQEIQPELSRREAALVRDILEMFDNLERSLGALTAAERSSLGENADSRLTFSGFDYNDSQEGRLADFARYLIGTGRWAAMAKYFDDQHEHGNSHFPVLAPYERMLTVWRPLWQKLLATYGGPDNYALTVDELQRVKDAWPHQRS